jgi:hypothetical protein
MLFRTFRRVRLLQGKSLWAAGIPKQQSQNIEMGTVAHIILLAKLVGSADLNKIRL